MGTNILTLLAVVYLRGGWGVVIETSERRSSVGKILLIDGSLPCDIDLGHAERDTPVEAYLSQWRLRQRGFGCNRMCRL